MSNCHKCGCEIDDMAECCPGCLTSVNSLVAAIEGNYSGMSKADLVLTCNMLLKGREAWRKEYDSLKARLDNASCLLACPGRGDCEHFIGLPSVFDEHTTDTYGKPNGWCWFCWWAYRTHKAESQSETEGLRTALRSVARHRMPDGTLCWCNEYFHAQAFAGFAHSPSCTVARQSLFVQDATIA